MKANLSPEHLRVVLESCWSAHTSNDPEWDRFNPSLGQCAVTAMVVNEFCLGNPGILRVVLADGRSHYFNEGEIDLTRDQFDVYEPAGESASVDFAYLSSNPDTYLRWFILRTRVEKLLSDV